MSGDLLDRRLPTIDLVREFHETYRQTIHPVPTIPSFTDRKLRALLILEELEEYVIASAMDSPTVFEGFKQLRACIERVHYNAGETANLVYAADALGDLDYVVAGANLTWGFPATAILEEIHRSNMSKLGEDGKPLVRADGKILKGPNYFEPQLLPIIERAANESQN